MRFGISKREGKGEREGRQKILKIELSENGCLIRIGNKIQSERERDIDIDREEQERRESNSLTLDEKNFLERTEKEHKK